MLRNGCPHLGCPRLSYQQNVAVVDGCYPMPAIAGHGAGPPHRAEPAPRRRAQNCANQGGGHVQGQTQGWPQARTPQGCAEGLSAFSRCTARTPVAPVAGACHPFDPAATFRSSTNSSPTHPHTLSHLHSFYVPALVKSQWQMIEGRELVMSQPQPLSHLPTAACCHSQIAFLCTQRNIRSVCSQHACFLVIQPCTATPAPYVTP